MEIKCKKGMVDQDHAIKSGRPVHGDSYRQRFFAVLDGLDVKEYLEIDSENRDKAIAYCYQMNALAPEKRFAVYSMLAGFVRIIREN